MSGSGGEQQAFFERYAPPDLRAESAEVGASKSGEEIRACADAILSDYDDAPVRSFVLPRLPAPAGLRRARISSARRQGRSQYRLTRRWERELGVTRALARLLARTVQPLHQPPRSTSHPFGEARQRA